MGCPLGKSWCFWQKPTLGSVAGAYQPSRWVANLFHGIQALRKFRICSDCLPVITEELSPSALATWMSTWMGPDRVEPWKWPNPVRKAKNFGWKVTVRIWAMARSFHFGVSVKSILLFLMICIHDFSLFVRWIVLHYICFTCERCNMSSINKRSARVVANL